MDIKNKIMNVLLHGLKAEYIRLEDDEGFSGFVVSRQFEGITALERQGLIDETLRNAPDQLTAEERRRVLMIAGLTPAEYDAVGPRVRVHRVKEKAGAVEILLHGVLSDAEYIRGVLMNHKGIQTTQPKQVKGASDILMSFRASGTTADPLTKAKVIRVLKKDPYIEVMANALPAAD